MKSQRGFTLIEMLIVLVIIGVVMAIAVPGLLRARQNAQAASAIQSLRTITTAEHLYDRRYKKYGTLTELGTEGSIDDNLKVGQKSAYNFVLNVQIIPHPGGPDEFHFTCNADPLVDLANSNFFFVNDTGVIRGNVGSAATTTSTPVPE
jgi:general secretion pathway protein G